MEISWQSSLPRLETCDQPMISIAHFEPLAKVYIYLSYGPMWCKYLWLAHPCKESSRVQAGQ